MLHLILAGCWLVLGGILLAWSWAEPTASSSYIWGTGIPLGWLGIAMALYNLLRWWLDRSARKAAHQRKETSLQQRRTVDAAGENRFRAGADDRAERGAAGEHFEAAAA